MNNKNIYWKIIILIPFVVVFTYKGEIQSQVVSNGSEDVKLYQIAGSGTINYIPKWTSISTIGNSIIYEIDDKIGIGTTNPLSTLHVYERSYGTTFLFDQKELRLFTYAPPYDISINMLNGYNSWKIQYNTIHQGRHLLQFMYNENAKMTLDSNGNVEIGLDNPTPIQVDINGQFNAIDANIINTVSAENALISNKITASEIEVGGKILAREIEVSLDAGADFVFEKDYNLKDLKEVENYILHNKHLPDVPSAKEMLDEGLNVTEFQIQLLQKVEELTLYVIELEKKIEVVKREDHKSPDQQ